MCVSRSVRKRSESVIPALCMLKRDFGLRQVGSMAGGSAAPSSAQAKELFRALLREARKFSNYNVREYVKRRTIDGFQEHQGTSDPAAIAAAYAYGKQQLEIAKRQAIVYSLYAPRVKSIMDLKVASSSSA